MKRVVLAGLCALLVDYALFYWVGSMDSESIGLRGLSFLVLLISWPSVVIEFALPHSLDAFSILIGIPATGLFWGVLIDLICVKMTPKRPNKSPEPTAVGAVSSAIAVHAASRRWLSFFR